MANPVPLSNNSGTRMSDLFHAKAPFYGVGNPPDNSTGTAPLIDLKYGGQFGHMVDYRALTSSNPYVKQHLTAVLIRSPRGFDYMPDPQAWHRSLKAIIEEQSKEISGLSATLSIENIEHEVGGAGEVISAVSNVTRERSNPSHTISEKYNMPVTSFINTWILELMMDPETKYPNIITRGTTSPIKDHMVDFYGATVLYFEPDPTFQFAIKAWLCMFVRPSEAGPTIEGSRSLTSSKEDLQIDLRFTATTQVGAGVNKLAQQVIQSLNVRNTNPWQRPAAYDGIHADVSAVSDAGYREGMAKAASSALTVAGIS